MPAPLSDDVQRTIIERVDNGEAKTIIAADLNISPRTVTRVYDRYLEWFADNPVDDDGQPLPAPDNVPAAPDNHRTGRDNLLTSLRPLGVGIVLGGLAAVLKGLL